MTTPRNPDFAERIATSFHNQPFSKTMGVELGDVAHGAVTLALPHHQSVLQQYGYIHGGCIGAVLDTCLGYAALSVIAANRGILTVEYKTTFLAPALGDRYLFKGRVVKPGRTLIFTEGDAFAITDGNEKKVATMTATMMAMDDIIEKKHD